MRIGHGRDCFVLEAKQAQDRPQQASLLGSVSEAERRATVRRTPGWAQAMLRAKGQAENYARDNADLTIGTDVKTAKPLRANEHIAYPGVKLHGAGFIVSPAQARVLGLGKVPGLEAHIRPYLNGRDLQQRSRGMMVIDLDGLAEDKVRKRFPAVISISCSR